MTKGITLYIIMSKCIVSPLIYEHLYDFVLRINLIDSAVGKIDKSIKQFSSCGTFYVLFEYPKKLFTFEYVKTERKRILKKYEDLGFRGKKAMKSTRF